MHNFSIYKISPTVLHTVMLYVNRLRFCPCPLLTKNAFVVGKVLRHLAHKSMHAKQLCVYCMYMCMCVAAVYQPIQLSTRQPVTVCVCVWLQYTSQYSYLPGSLRVGLPPLHLPPQREGHCPQGRYTPLSRSCCSLCQHKWIVLEAGRYYVCTPKEIRVPILLQSFSIHPLQSCTQTPPSVEDKGLVTIVIFELQYWSLV